MGIVNCSVHGESGFMPYVSKELANIIKNNIKLDKNSITYVTVSLQDDESDEVVYEMKYWMSKECFDSLSANPTYIIRTEQDEEKVDEIFNPVMKGGGYCGECFNEYMMSIGYELK